MNTNETKPDYSTKRLPNTPFTMFKQHDEIHLLLGEYKVTDKTFSNESEISQYLNDNKYDVMITIALIVLTKTQQIKKNDTDNTMEGTPAKAD